MIVAGVGCRKAQQFRVFIHALDNRAQKYKELCVFMRCFPRIKQILPIIRAQRPVYMLAAAVHACEGLFVQQAGHIMVSGNSLHCLHNQLVMVCCLVAVLKNRCQLMLCRCNLVMLCLCRHTQLP